MKSLSNVFKNGSFTSVYAGSTQGLHGVLISLISLFGGLATYRATSSIAYSVVIATMIELIMFVFSLIGVFINISLREKGILNIFKSVFKKFSWVTIVAGIFGGSFGTLALTLGINYAGESYGIVLSVIFPVVSAIIAHFIFKERINWKGAIALIGILTSAILIVLLEAGSGSYRNLFLGIALGAVGGVFWALEAVIVSYFFRNNKHKTTDIEALMSRQFGSSLFLLVIIVPSVSLFSSNKSIGFDIMGEIFRNWDALLFTLFCALNLFLSWLAYFNAIKMLGTTNAASINITYSIWAPIWAMIVYPATSHSWSVPSWSYFVFSVTLIISIFLLLKSIKPTNKEKQTT